MDTKDLLTYSRLLKSHSVCLDNIEGGLFFTGVSLLNVSRNEEEEEDKEEERKE